MPDREAQRVCFLLQLKPELTEDYLDAHQEVWPEMLDALREAGWHNYSLFVRPEDGYLETQDFVAATSRMANTAVNQKWQAGMAKYFDTADDRHPDEAMRPLTEYFHLA